MSPRQKDDHRLEAGVSSEQFSPSASDNLEKQNGHQDINKAHARSERKSSALFCRLMPANYLGEVPTWKLNPPCVSERTQEDVVAGILLPI